MVFIIKPFSDQTAKSTWGECTSQCSVSSICDLHYTHTYSSKPFMNLQKWFFLCFASSQRSAKRHRFMSSAQRDSSHILTTDTDECENGSFHPGCLLVPQRIIISLHQRRSFSNSLRIRRRFEWCNVARTGGYGLMKPALMPLFFELGATITCLSWKLVFVSAIDPEVCVWC